MLRLLRDSSLTEWEILSRLNVKYGLNPTAKEFSRLERMLLGKGFASMEVDRLGNRLHITPAGLTLLERLEQEYRLIVTRALLGTEDRAGSGGRLAEG